MWDWDSVGLPSDFRLQTPQNSHLCLVETSLELTQGGRFQNRFSGLTWDSISGLL